MLFLNFLFVPFVFGQYCLEDGGQICCVEDWEWKDVTKIKPSEVNYDADDLPNDVYVNDKGDAFEMDWDRLSDWAYLCELVCFNFERFGCNGWQFKTGDGKCKLMANVATDSNQKYKDGSIRSHFCPTASPTVLPTQEPTSAPVSPVPDPTAEPTAPPTPAPTADPTADPTASPVDPVTQPTAEPTASPVDPTTPEPTASPVDPTPQPTGAPVGAPTPEPTPNPNGETPEPTFAPTPAPVEDGQGQTGGSTNGQENDSPSFRDTESGRTYYIVVFSMGSFLFIVLLLALFWMSKKDSRKEALPTQSVAGIQMTDAGEKTAVNHTNHGFEPGVQIAM